MKANIRADPGSAPDDEKDSCSPLLAVENERMKIALK